VSFHPDDDFSDYVYFKVNKSCNTKEEAEKRNSIMQQYFEVCEKNGLNIYSLVFDLTLKETGMDRYILCIHNLFQSSYSYKLLGNVDSHLNQVNQRNISKLPLRLKAGKE
jgi:hypothetical protein